jgi:hypothetical protein
MVYRLTMVASTPLGSLTAGFAALLWLGLITPAWGQTVDPAAHWPLPPAELEQRLAYDDFTIRSVRGGVGGVMGVKKLKIVFSGREDWIPVKWKEAPPRDADGWNNTPRKEIAAYEIQKWFLDPVDYVVPTTVARCIPFDDYGPLDEAPKANLSGTRCVLGTLVVWLEEVTVPEKLFEEERFASDARYAYHLANMNLLTYLIEHEDGRQGNFLVSEIESDRRVFSIDNGVSFGAKMKNFFVLNWNKIRVPALRRETIERLRRVTPEQIEALGVLAELRTDDSGVLRPVPLSANAKPRKGARAEPGWVQLGLSSREIKKLRKRIERLLVQVDGGRQPVF